MINVYHIGFIGMKVALLNAHTAYSPGAVQTLEGFPTSEYYWSHKINTILLKLIQDNHPNNSSAIIDTSNIKPYNKSLSYKAFFVKRDGYDLTVETHLNSAVTKLATGIEVLYGIGRVESKNLATNLAESLAKFIPLKLRHGNGVIDRKNLYILKAIQCPSVIVEVLFLSNEKDKSYLTFPRSAEIIANSLYEGILNYISTKGVNINGGCAAGG